jgi:crossover junction endodeoxyribonuclease RuvC
VSKIIGIDPGASGALCLLDTDNNTTKFFDPPVAKIKGKNVIVTNIFARNFKDLLPADHCVIEEVHSMPRDGSSSAFKFGTAFGMVKAFAAYADVPTTFVQPAMWKRKLKLNGADKDASRILAIQLYPKSAPMLQRKKDHGRAEALLLAHGFAEGLL